MADRVAAFVHQAVVVATQEHQVVEPCLAAVRPVVDVVGVDEALAGAAGKAAALIAAFQGPPQGRGNTAGAATHVQGGAVGGFQPPDHAAVASEPPRRFRTNASA